MPAYWATVGRIILGLFFLSSGVAKIIGEPMAMQETIRHGFPMVTTLYWAAAILETVGGGALLLGIATAWSAALLGAVVGAFLLADPSKNQTCSPTPVATCPASSLLG